MSGQGIFGIGSANGLDVAIKQPLDAFGRVRFSQPQTIFDNKRLSDGIVSLFWDDQETAGAGTNSTYNLNRASTTLSVSNLTAGTREQQTFRSFNYQPGKSQLVFMTFTKALTGTGNKKWAGYKNTNNGLFFQSNGGVLEFVIRSNTTGTPVDTTITQANWNIDSLSNSIGNNPSGIDLDPTKSQIFVLDFEWLGVGSVRFGFVINGEIVYAHQQNNANIIEPVYMSSPNLPLQYGISNDGTGAADEFEIICSTVISEGGSDRLGVTRGASTDGTHVTASLADTLYAVLGIRLQSTHLYLSSRIERVTMISETNDDFEWVLLFNPTVAGTFTYVNETLSCMQVARGATANTVSGGIRVDNGESKSRDNISTNLDSALELGASIAGVRDTYVLCVRAFTNNASIHGSITWRELL